MMRALATNAFLLLPTSPLQDDEEIREYRPSYIQESLANLPIWLGATKEEFEEFFNQNYRSPHCPKSDVEYQWVWQATVVTCT